MEKILEQLKDGKVSAAFEKLSVDDLDNIAGGRDIRRSELDDFDTVVRKLSKLVNSASSEAEERRYVSMYEAAMKKWEKAIKSAPEDSADIYFSDYLVL